MLNWRVLWFQLATAMAFLIGASSTRSYTIEQDMEVTVWTAQGTGTGLIASAAAKTSISGRAVTAQPATATKWVSKCCSSCEGRELSCLRAGSLFSLVLFAPPFFFLFVCLRTPRCNFPSTLYPRSWRIIQVIHSQQSASKINHTQNNVLKKTPWPQSASELDRPSDRRLSAKLVPTFCG
jgi:hypothetical protein